MKKTSAKKNGSRVKVGKLKLNRETVRNIGKHESNDIKGGIASALTCACRPGAQDGTTDQGTTINPIEPVVPFTHR